MKQTVIEKYEHAPKTWYVKILIALIAAALIAWSSSTLEGGATGGDGWSIAGRIFSGIFHPDTDLLFDLGKSGVAYLLLETMCIAFLGTIVGAVFSIPLSFLSATNLVPKPIAVVVHTVIMAIRTIPPFVYGLMFIRVTGPGAFAGLMTMSVCSIGMVSKCLPSASKVSTSAFWNRSTRQAATPSRRSVTAFCPSCSPTSCPR